MNLICKRDILSYNINIVSKAVSVKSTTPILECILLKVENNEFILVANDLEMAIKTAPITSVIIEEGSVAINARMFTEIVKKLPDSDINIISDDKNNIIEIVCDNSNFKILGSPAIDFPEFPDFQRNNEFILKQLVLKNLIRESIFAIAQTDDKSAFTGELFDIEDSWLSVVAVDGFRIAYRKYKFESPVNDCNVIIPGKTLNEISKILSTDDKDDVSIFILDNHVLFDLSSCIVLSRTISAQFINYKDMFNDCYDTLIKINKAQFLLALERASLISRENKRTAIKMKLSNDCMIINSNTQLGTAHEQLPIDMTGNDLEISFNPKYLIDVLKVLDSDTISIQLTTPLSPCIIRVTDDEQFNYLVLPLRIK